MNTQNSSFSWELIWYYTKKQHLVVSCLSKTDAHPFGAVLFIASAVAVQRLATHRIVSQMWTAPAEAAVRSRVWRKGGGGLKSMKGEMRRNMSAWGRVSVFTTEELISVSSFSCGDRRGREFGRLYPRTVRTKPTANVKLSTTPSINNLRANRLLQLMTQVKSRGEISLFLIKLVNGRVMFAEFPSFFFFLLQTWRERWSNTNPLFSAATVGFPRTDGQAVATCFKHFPRGDETETPCLSSLLC